MAWKASSLPKRHPRYRAGEVDRTPYVEDTSPRCFQSAPALLQSRRSDSNRLLLPYRGSAPPKEPLRRYQRQVVDTERIELSFPGCRPGVFPLDDAPIQQREHEDSNLVIGDLESPSQPLRYSRTAPRIRIELISTPGQGARAPSASRGIQSPRRESDSHRLDRSELPGRRDEEMG